MVALWPPPFRPLPPAPVSPAQCLDWRDPVVEQIPKPVPYSSTSRLVALLGPVSPVLLLATAIPITPRWDK